MATIEMVPLIAMFLFLSCYTIGFFGIIHTGIMNSISGRAYAFETFRGRTDLTYFRDLQGADNKIEFSKLGNRSHAIQDETWSSSYGYHGSARPLRIGSAPPPAASDQDLDLHNNGIYDKIVPGKRTQLGVETVWVKVAYGICLNVRCGNGS